MKVQRRRRDIIVAISLGIIAIALGMILSLGGLGVLPPKTLRGLGQTVVINTFNPWNKTLTSYSLNAVSAVIWDYRGLDTIFETSVLLAAVTGLTVLFHKVLEIRGLKSRGTTSIVKTSTKFVIVLILFMAISIAVHGHLTPGGGFQAGSIIATIIALTITVFSIEFLYEIGLRKELLLKARFILLMLMVLVALMPLTTIYSNGIAYVMQNQVKEGSVFSAPSRFFNTPLAGTVFIFNVIEAATVALALSYILTIFTKRKEELKDLIEDVER